MKRLLSILFLACVTSAFGAAGDYIGAQIDPQGWQLWLEFAAMGTNGTFGSLTTLQPGTLVTNNAYVANGNITLTVRSQGFDSTGAATTFQRTIYGTQRIRQAYPDNAFPDVVSNSVSTTIKFALSDFVYSGDSNITVTAVAGIYSSNSVNSAVVTAMPVTNNSARLYPLPVANWTWPGWNRETNANMRLRAVGFAQTADNGQPLAGMRFIVSQTNGTTITNWVSAMTIDRTLPDAIPFGEYIADFALSQFTNYTSGGDNGQLRCNFQAVPRLGTASTVFSTTDSGTVTSLAATITNVCDRLQTYCTVIAVVDPAGSDANGRVTNQTPANVNSAHYFATIRGAALQIAATNNAAAGHNDPGGGFIYVRSGITNWTGGADITSTPAAWVTVLPYPGDVMSNLTTQLTGTAIGHRVKLYQMPLGGGLSGNLFLTSVALWMDQCTINSASTSFCRVSMWYTTDCTIPKMVQGFKNGVGITTTQPCIERGNTITGYDQGAWGIVHTIVGNHQYSNAVASVITYDFVGQTTPPSYGSILYNNRFNFHQNSASARMTAPGPAGFDVNSNGFAVVQNVFENSTNAAGALIDFGSFGVQYTNVVFWNNLVVGQKMFNWYAYNASTNKYRWGCQSLNNMEDNYDLKSDVYTLTHDNTNNWEELWSVNWQGNCWMESTNPSAAPALFLNSKYGGFDGLNIIAHTNVFTDRGWAQFISKQYYDGSPTYDWPGEGNYRTTSDAPQRNLITRWVLPFDLEGNHRGKLDPPGAYASATPRKGAGFFGQ